MYVVIKKHGTKSRVDETKIKNNNDNKRRRMKIQKITYRNLAFARANALGFPTIVGLALGVKLALLILALVCEQTAKHFQLTSKTFIE